MGFLGSFYLFILTRGWVVARATQPKTRLGRVAISQNPTQTRGLTSVSGEVGSMAGTSRSSLAATS
jgi:uncharacterized protein YraI